MKSSVSFILTFRIIPSFRFLFPSNCVILMCYPNADIYSCVVKTQVAYPYQKYLFICTISDYLDSEKPTFDLYVEP